MSQTSQLYPFTAIEPAAEDMPRFTRCNDILARLVANGMIRKPHPARIAWGNPVILSFCLPPVTPRELGDTPEIYATPVKPRQYHNSKFDYPDHLRADHIAEFLYYDYLKASESFEFELRESVSGKTGDSINGGADKNMENAGIVCTRSLRMITKSTLLSTAYTTGHCGGDDVFSPPVFSPTTPSTGISSSSPAVPTHERDDADVISMNDSDCATNNTIRLSHLSNGASDDLYTNDFPDYRRPEMFRPHISFADSMDADHYGIVNSQTIPRKPIPASSPIPDEELEKARALALATLTSADSSNASTDCVHGCCGKRCLDEWYFESQWDEYEYSRRHEFLDDSVIYLYHEPPVSRFRAVGTAVSSAGKKAKKAFKNIAKKAGSGKKSSDGKKTSAGKRKCGLSARN
ncbi:hypothetical protein EJ06DRAFT_554016 [Trichodelitschia bisporula]|uniref:Uncharacterized protein n=1 Tax=Trichodelitschia bisporula TaxID=703511 RepID=A0A6G1I672_9PEZI|nr:hypothetical protein EJ06DRAFT_554016 [Trichodelitschia bisporula]